MNRSRLLISVVIIAVILAGAFVLVSGNDDSEDQEKQTVFTVGILSGSPIFDSAIASMQTTLAEAGYVEGDNIIYDMRSADGDNDVMAQIASDFVENNVDLIVTTTNAGALAGRQATEGTDIPVVFMFVIAPVENGVVNDLTEIDNVTGVRNPLEDFVGRRINMLQSIDPTATRIWAPYNSQYPTVTVVTEKLRDIAPSLDVEIVETLVNTSDEVIAEIEALDSQEEVDIDAIFIFPDLTVQTAEAWQAILDFANKHQLPILANTGAQVEDGALFSYLSRNDETGIQAARLVSLILAGTSVQDLPVETAELFLIVNLEAAENLGLEINDDVLNQADTIIYGDETE